MTHQRTHLARPRLAPLCLAFVLAGSAWTQAALEHPPAATDPARLELVLEGLVLEPDGRPAAGAVVISSAGGRAVVGADGAYRLELHVSPSAESVQLTAVGRGGAQRTASTSVDLAFPAVPVDPLTLVQGATCLTGWLPTFGVRPGVNGAVRALAVFDDGTGPALFVGGNFTEAGSTPAANVAKWDGTSWTALGEGTNDEVYALVVHDDGNGPALYAGGDFPRAGGQIVRRIARWDGTSWSALADGLSGGGAARVWSLAVHDDGSGPALYAGGSFLNSGATSVRQVARWDGASWSALGAHVSGYVTSLVTFDDGGGEKLYAGGDFGTAGTVTANNVARWDGTSWSALGTGTDDLVLALAVFDDGSGPALFAGGGFMNAGGAPATRIARWDGASWSGLGSGTDHRVWSLAAMELEGTPYLFVGGYFGSAGGVQARGIARWDGATWTGMDGGLFGTITPTPPVFAMLPSDLEGAPELVVGGWFDSVGEVGAASVATWDGAWGSLGQGPWRSVEDLEVHDDGGGPALYAAGNLLSADGVFLNHVGRWDGSTWTPLAGGTNHQVRQLRVYDDGGGPALFATGFFTEAGGIPANRIARWDGSSWTALGAGLDNSGLALTVYDAGLGNGPGLVVGGNFQNAGGVSASRVARWNGTAWAALGVGMNDIVKALAVFDAGGGPELYAGGDFSLAGGVSASRIARWDGATWSPLGAGVGLGQVLVMEVHDDGSGPALYVGGSFTSAGGLPAQKIARWDGSSWTSLGDFTGGPTGVSVDGLTSYDDGGGPDLYVGGDFTAAAGLAASNIARWDGAAWSALGSGTSRAVLALKTFDAGNGPALFAGGEFRAFDSGDCTLARWGCDDVPPVLACPTTVTACERPGSALGEVVTFTVTATDNLDPAPSIVCFPPSGSVFPFGTTLVTCTATDSEGNQAQCQFPVTVREKRAQAGF